MLINTKKDKCEEDGYHGVNYELRSLLGQHHPFYNQLDFSFFLWTKR